MTLPAELRAERDRPANGRDPGAAPDGRMVTNSYYHDEATRALLHRAADALEWEIAGWLPLASAPRDGTKVQLINIGTGIEDAGCWADYSHETQEYRDQMWPAHFRNADGSWPDGEWCQDKGNGDMTHWRPLDAPLPATPED